MPRRAPLRRCARARRHRTAARACRQHAASSCLRAAATTAAPSPAAHRPRPCRCALREDLTPSTKDHPVRITYTNAKAITEIAAPAPDATSLALPAVPDGFTVAIKSSDKPEIVGLDGATHAAGGSDLPDAGADGHEHQGWQHRRYGSAEGDRSGEDAARLGLHKGLPRRERGVGAVVDTEPEAGRPVRTLEADRVACTR